MSKQVLSNNKEIIIHGVPASPGIAMGKAYVHQRNVPEIETSRIEDDHVEDQIMVFRSARKNLQNQWKQLREKETDKQSKAILDAQITIISDPDLKTRVEKLIEDELHGAQYAIDKAFENYIEKLSKAGNTMMTDRLVDLYDIRNRLLEAAGPKAIPSFFKNGDILIAEEISPREVIQLSHQNIKGFVMERGGNTSHAAIIARSVGIPAVVGAKGIIDMIKNQAIVCLDGEQGLVSINPSKHTRKHVERLRNDQMSTIEEQLDICEQPSKTADDKSFIIRANVEFPEELKNVEQFNAEGIGLLRTESVYLNQEQFGHAENQASIYEKMLTHTQNFPVVIRLFDVGGDKFRGTKISESNPFLGWRGIRMLLDERTILREQLKAILTTAGKYPGRVKLLVPMVSTLEEIKEVKKEVKKCHQELANANIAVDENIVLGMMVEIPSVAIQANHFAPEVDFFSIGTNDLTQYLLAVDRGNALISKLYNQAHPAMWKLINHIIKIAHKNNIEVDVCGELAANPVAAACLIGAGVSSLSMSPVWIPHVKQLLIKRSKADMEELAEQVQLCVDGQEVETLFNNWKDTVTND